MIRLVAETEDGAPAGVTSLARPGQVRIDVLQEIDAPMLDTACKGSTAPC